MKSIIIIFNITPFPYFLQNDLYIFLENTHTLTFLKLKVDHIIEFMMGEGKAKAGRFSQRSISVLKNIYMVV